jgi:DegV family protein with EDD domain
MVASPALAPLMELDGTGFGRLLRAGIRQLLADQEHLNKINVFPVADGDTGTNMALTLRAVLHQLQQRPDLHIGNTLTRVADAALDAARGNSGAILAQFLLGLGDSAAQSTTLSTAQFAAAVTTGSNYARDSVSEPQQGTLLTILAVFATEINRLSGLGVAEFPDLFTRALPVVRRALQATRTELEQLRDANVVDAGAKGFVDLLDGMLLQLNGEQPDLPIEISDELPAHEDSIAAGTSAELDQRYCVECTLLGASVELRKLREQLAPLGSSLVLAGTQRKVRIHIHVNQPSEVFELAARYGSVSSHKADDMQRQQYAAHAPVRRVAILTDSVADLPDSMVEELGIHMVPLRIHFGTRSYLDKAGMSSVDFLEELVRNPVHPTTSQPPNGEFRRNFEFLATHFDSVISITVSARLSGTHGSAVTAAQRVQPADRVTVIDTLNVSIGQGLLVMYAAQCAARGMDRDGIVGCLRAAIPKVRGFALAGSLEYAVRGGRIRPFAKTLAQYLAVTPILATQPDGRVTPQAALFGRRDLQHKFAAWLSKRMDPQRTYRIGIGHAAAEAQAQQLLETLQKLRPRIESSFVMPIGSTLAAHSGPGTLVVGMHELMSESGENPVGSRE